MKRLLAYLFIVLSLGFIINLTNINLSHALFEKGICASNTYGSQIKVKYSYSGKCKDYGALFISKNDYPSYQGKKYSGFDGSGANKKNGARISISSMMSRYKSDEVINKLYNNFEYYKKNKNYNFYIIDLTTFNIGKFKNGEFIAVSKIDKKNLNFCADISFSKNIKMLKDFYFTDTDFCSLNSFYEIADKIKWDFSYSSNFSKAYYDQESFYINNDYSIFLSEKQTQIAKVKSNEVKTIENSQVEKLSIDNQKLTFCVDDRVKNRYSPYINTSNYECGGNTKKTNFAKYIEWKFRWNFERINNFQKTEKELFQIVKDTLVRETERYGLNKSEIEKFISNSKYSKFETQIAKAEPSQMRTMAIDKNKFLVIHILHGHGHEQPKSTIGYDKNKNKAIQISKKNCEKIKVNSWDCDDYFYFYKGDYYYRNMFSKEENDKLVTSILNPLHKLEFYKAFSIIRKQETQIAKAEPSQTLKKTKKKENKQIENQKVTNQEEFKPKKTNQDKDPPIIEVAENITVSDSAYEIKGNVKDKSKKIFIEVDGQTIPVKKGKFKIERFSPVDEQIKIVAIDQWGNRSKPKIVNVTIDIQNIEVAQKIEPLNPTKMRSRKNKDRIALIIGIEKYDQIPSASYANLDAKFFYEYARKGFGISKSNIKLLIDEDADLVKSLGTLNKWLPGKIKSNQTELIIFFAGHGLASNDGKELYILPQDSDPDLLDRTALSRTELFKQIIDLNPKSVTMFMDTCYSGISRDEKMLLASARPVRIVANEEEGIPDNFTIFSASQLDQISSGIKEAKHGIFSYYLMKGLEGNADANKDRNITNGELLVYMDENVSQKASELGRQQNPSFVGDPNTVLSKY